MSGNLKTSAVDVIVFLLIFLWVYAAISKLADYDQSRTQMLEQVFSNAVSEILVWAIPLAELGTALLLISHKTKTRGMYVSFSLLFVFTFYIIVVLTGVFDRIPCSCGGILENLSWTEHLLFNVFFLVLTLIALIQTSEDGRAMGKAI